MKKEPQLIVALDFPEKALAMTVAKQLKGVVPWVKVGMELFTLCGPAILEELRTLGFSVFLDMKFYDIPHTVAQAVKAATRSGANLMTLHAQGGQRMCESAREAAEQCSAAGQQAPLLFAVTVLTSFAAGEMPGIQAAPSDFAFELAGSAATWGMDGVVCSAQEAARIKVAAPQLLCLCPGIRPEGAALDDQRRVMTPAKAILAGADFLVVGRPITKATQPVEAAKTILAEMHRNSAL